MPNTAAFPVISSVEAWKPLVASVLREIAVVLVRTPDIDQAIQDLSGFPGWDHWGVIQTPNGEYPKGRRDMSFAVSRLRDEGLVESPKRGSFILTGNLPVTEPTVTEPTVTEPTVTEPTVKVGKVLSVEENVFSERPNNHPILEEDEGLLIRLTSKTPCFGAWKKGDHQCVSCPLAGSCFDTVPVRMASIEREVGCGANSVPAAPAAAPAAPAPAPAAPAAPAAAPAATVFEEDERMIQDIGGRIEKVGFPVFCRLCTTPVTPNAKFVRWSGPKDPNSPDVAAGNYHVHCFLTLLGGGN